MNVRQFFSPSKLAMALPVFGTLVFYLWQPINDYFITGGYNDNVVLAIESETIKVDNSKQLLVLHIKPQNRGNVPVDILSKSNKGKFTVEVRKIENIDNFKWLEESKMPLISSTDILRNHKDGYTIESGAFYDEVETIQLPIGLYWVKAKLTFSNSDYVDESTVVKLSNE